MTCDDNELCSKSKVRRKITNQEQSEYGLFKNRGMTIYAFEKKKNSFSLPETTTIIKVLTPTMFCMIDNIKLAVDITL